MKDEKMFKNRNDGRYRLEFFFTNGGLGWLVTDDLAQAQGWWDIFAKPQDRDLIGSIAFFDNNVFIKEYRPEDIRLAA
jgi:hypothetical protein